MSEMVMLPPEEIVERIKGFGFRMYVGPDGLVHGQPNKPGMKIPLEMQPILEQMRMQNSGVAEIIRNQTERVVLKDLTEEQAQPWIAAVRSGEYRLASRVEYSRGKKTASFILERV